MTLHRRTFLSIPVATASLALATGARASRGPLDPVLLVHGNGGSAAFWMGFVWRMEANGYPAELIHALDFAAPIARSSGLDVDDESAIPGRSSTADQLAELTAAIDRTFASAGSQRVVLIGHSRAGNAIRSYLWRAGAVKVSRVVLAATTTNGLIATDRFVNNEFNGQGAFMRTLNARTIDVPPGVPTLSLRSDSNDLWFQPDGRFIGLPGRPTGIGYDAPDVRGATNVVLPGADHKQVALGDAAFDAIHRFMLGAPPAVVGVPTTSTAVLDGIVTAFRDGAPSNLPVAGARVEVFEASPETGERAGTAVHAQTTGSDGRWGPYSARPDRQLEFLVRIAGLPATSIVCPPFPRGSSLVRLSPAIPSPEERAGEGLIVIRRPRGLSGAGRDVVRANGAPARPRAESVYRFLLDTDEPVPGIAAHAVPVGRGAVRIQVNAETVTVRARPLDEAVVVAEFHG